MEQFCRYYGASYPANLSFDSAEGFRWLTTAQALADIPVAKFVDLTNDSH